MPISYFYMLCYSAFIECVLCVCANFTNEPAMHGSQLLQHVSLHMHVSVCILDSLVAIQLVSQTACQWPDILSSLSLFPYSYISGSHSILHCLCLHQGKCQCTHLSVGLADPRRLGYIHNPRGSQKARRERVWVSEWVNERVSDRGRQASDPCSWQVSQAWSTWNIKPSGCWPNLPNSDHTCWACKTTV